MSGPEGCVSMPQVRNGWLGRLALACFAAGLIVPGAWLGSWPRRSDSARLPLTSHDSRYAAVSACLAVFLVALVLTCAVGWAVWMERSWGGHRH
ncbi:MAG: hypothetical protein KBD01_18790 [Acidobacteria bacterium]|nr:hypothetical protein [Acidobacteriota bacterium]